MVKKQETQNNETQITEKQSITWYHDKKDYRKNLCNNNMSCSDSKDIFKKIC